MEAWSVHHKTDGCLSLITPANYCLGWFDPVTGFNQKSGIIQSGVNTMQMSFVLELQFAPPEEYCTLKIDLGSGSDVELLRLYSSNYYELQAFACMIK